MEKVNTLTPSQAAAAGGAAGATIGIMASMMIAFYIFIIIAGWRILKKAGEPGWKILIPFYNVYMLMKIVNMKSWFWWLLAIYICGSIMIAIDIPNLSTMSNQQMSMINWGQHPMTIIAIIATLAIGICTNIVYAWRTSKVFGHGVGYFLGLFFLEPIFWLILGFDKSKYNKKNLLK